MSRSFDPYDPKFKQLLENAYKLDSYSQTPKPKPQQKNDNTLWVCVVWIAVCVIWQICKKGWCKRKQNGE